MTHISDDFEIDFANRRIKHTTQSTYDVNSFYRYLTSTIAIRLGRYCFMFTWRQWRFWTRCGQAVHFGPFSVLRV